MSSRALITQECSVCPRRTTQVCAGCRNSNSETRYCSTYCQKLFRPSHKYLCGKDSTSFIVPPLSKEEAAKLDLYSHVPWSHENCPCCDPPEVGPPGATLFEIISFLGLYEGDWHSFLSQITTGGDLLPEPQLSSSLILARASLLSENREYPLLNESLGIESFNMACQQMAPLITCPSPNDPNPLRTFNSLFRLSLDHNTVLTIIKRERDSYGFVNSITPPVQFVSYERFLNGLTSFDSSILEPKAQRWLRLLIKRYVAAVKSLGRGH
ncbi:hypothetical protein JCM5350_003549 [Sporobolomyces pararoseus]